jgi:hypothetical protein
MPPLQVAGVTYHGGFSHLGIGETRPGSLVMDDDAVTLRWMQNGRDYRPHMEICRTRAIATIEVTSEQAAKSKLGAAVVFGVLGAVTAKGSMDRASMLVTLRNGETGYFTIQKQSTASLLGVLTPWLREHGIALGSPDVESAQPALAPKLIADELVKLAHLRDSGVLSEEEFAALKGQLIQDATGGE